LKKKLKKPNEIRRIENITIQKKYNSLHLLFSLLNRARREEAENLYGGYYNENDYYSMTVKEALLAKKYSVFEEEKRREKAEIFRRSIIVKRK
jgi:hypothetical protein